MKILIVEDSERLRRNLKKGLEQEGYVVDLAVDGDEGSRFCEIYRYDIVVLDLMMPNLDGYGFIEARRKIGDNTHILVLSAKDQLLDRVSALDLGADDFLMKPFAFEELISRIKAGIRRTHNHKSPSIKINSLVIDTVAKTVFYGGNSLALSPFEYNCFEYLVNNRGQVISKEKIIGHLHNAEDDFQSNVVEALIYSLRKKLAVVGADALVQTKRGFGYFIS